MKLVGMTPFTSKRCLVLRRTALWKTCISAIIIPYTRYKKLRYYELTWKQVKSGADLGGVDRVASTPYMLGCQSHVGCIFVFYRQLNNHYDYSDTIYSRDTYIVVIIYMCYSLFAALFSKTFLSQPPFNYPRSAPENNFKQMFCCFFKQ